MRVRGLLIGVVAVTGACPPPEPPAAPPIPPVSTGKVRVRVFTEPSPARLLAPAGRFVFVGTDNELERWDVDGGVLTLSADHGLSGSHVAAMAPDPERRWVWILTEGGLGHYDAGAELYREMPPPPASVGVDFVALAKEATASVAPAEDGGAWLASARGLVYVSAQGGWASTPIKDPIRALARDSAGWLWVAAKGGLIARKPTGETLRIGAAQGLAVAEPRILVELAEGRMLVIGADAEGHDRLGVGKQLSWVTYRALPELRWDAAARRGAGAVVMGGDRVYRIAPASAAQVRPLAREGMRLVAVAGAGTGSTEWVIDPIDLVVPPGAVTVSSADEQLLIGTRDLGTARYREGDAHPRGWLRRKEMFQDATTLSVACARAQDCWIATGARQAWHWTGDRFAASGPDQVVLAVVRDPTGPLYALHRGTGETEIHLSRIDGAGWTAVPKVALATPGTRPEVSFARFATPGSLWVGLRYHDGVERRAYGLAIVETATGKTAYHRTEAAGTGGKGPKMLPIPVGVVDADVRGGVAWFATSEGVARLMNGEVKVWTEADGLRSELARAVTIAPDGAVIVATGAGAAVWNGTAWDFPAALRFEINDVVATRNGQVWMATERGIAAWDGKKVRRVDVLRGLAENEMLDIAVDQFDRVWARGPGSLTLISQ